MKSLNTINQKEIKKNSDKPVDFFDVLNRVNEELKSVGILDKTESEWLISSILKKKKFELRKIKTISSNEEKQVYKALKRRKRGEPLNRILGEVDFLGCKIKISKNVMSPRPETELMTEKVIMVAKELLKRKTETQVFPCSATLTMLDLCTGSGAIAIATKKQIENSKIFASDISEKALRLAKKNAKINNVKITFIKSAMFDDLKNDLKYDIIVSNPPYIKTLEIENLGLEVKKYDPHLSLDGGEDGLEFYRIIAKEVKNFLAEHGILFLEIGKTQSNEVKKLFKNDFNNIEVIKDYGGNDRIVIVKNNNLGYKI